MISNKNLLLILFFVSTSCIFTFFIYFNGFFEKNNNIINTIKWIFEKNDNDKIKDDIISTINKLSLQRKEIYNTSLIWQFHKINIEEDIVKLYLKKNEGYYHDNGFFYFRNELNNTVFNHKNINKLEVFIDHQHFNLCDLTDMMGGCKFQPWIETRQTYKDEVILESI